MNTETTSYAGRIVVGSDGSEGARHALRWAARHAVAHGSALTVLRVGEVLPPIPSYVGMDVGVGRPVDWSHDHRKRVRAGLDREVADLQAEFPDLSIAGDFREEESPALALAQAASRADLLVLGATGVSAVARTLLGGTVSQVIEHAHGSVAVVPEQDGVEDGPVVVGMDDSDEAKAVLERGIAEARATSGRLLVAHGLDLPATVLPYLDEAEVARGCARWLAEVTAPADDAGLTVDRRVLRGRPADVLADLSKEASVLVTGSRGRGGFTGLLLGSVSRGVIRHAECPVIVVRG